MQHETFRYTSLADIQAKKEALGVDFPMSTDVSALFAPLQLGHVRAENRIAFQPMEGTDGTLTGAPDELTCRRYLRFAKGGPGLIWYEAVATVPEARASAQAINAMCPLSEMFGYATDLRSRTQGRGTFSMQFDHYEEVPHNVAEKVVGRGK